MEIATFRELSDMYEILWGVTTKMFLLSGSWEEACSNFSFTLPSSSMVTARKEAVSHFLFKCWQGKCSLPYVLQIAQKVDNILILFRLSKFAERKKKSCQSTEEARAQHFCGDQVTWGS